MRKTLLSLLSLAMLGFAPAPVFREKPNDPDAVLRRLQGGWRGVSYSQGGKDIMGGAAFRMQVEKDTWRFFNGTPSRESNSYTISLDTKANPMRIDWRNGGTHLKGIFVLSGDKLHYSYRQPDKGYPTSLTAPASEDYVIEAKREK